MNERAEDIPLLVEHFASMIAGETGNPVREFTPAAMKAMQNLAWTGNIRELRNVVERLIILGGEKISEEDVFKFVMPFDSALSGT